MKHQITVNVNILDTFEGAGLTVCGRADGKLHRKHAMTYGHKLVRKSALAIHFSSALTFCDDIGSCHHPRRYSTPRKSRWSGWLLDFSFSLTTALHCQGADAITEGERMNLIIWCRSSAHRLSDDTDQRRRMYGLICLFQLLAMIVFCTRHSDMTIAPDVKCLSRTHDPDYKDWAGPELKK